MKTISIVAIVIAIVLVAGAAAVVVMHNNSNDDDRQTITVTMAWEEDIVEEIAGDEYNVVSMMPSNVSPHTTYSQPSTVAELYSSTVYFMVGSGIEWETAFMDDVISQIPDSVEIVKLADEIEYTPLYSVETSESGEYDVHIWTSPDNLAKMAEVIMDKLIELNPDNASVYEANYEAYMDKVDAVNDKMTELADLVGDEEINILVWHPAWQYFIEQYGAEMGLNANMIGVESQGEVSIEDAVTLYKDYDVIYVSVTDEGYEYRDVLEENGINVEVVNPTPDDMLESLSDFIDLLMQEYAES
ncbi:MAG: metal ABC transporter substrate-binding protein [Candidatus Methanogranum gryphiswaldense]|nr:MAG: metal ABC transporter substrate-binding protein [Candidatus Methanogranum sp. U3.2.1]